MNILWIEDFGGTLSSGTETLESMFKGLLSFDEWDEDSLNLIKSPQDLEKFCKQQNSQHCIYLCRNYFDYVEFKANHAIMNEIDLVISDINLENRAHVSLDLAIPEAYADNKTKFHANAGFFIFNDLIYLGFPEKRMCFMTGEKNSLKDFTKKCSEIYMPEVIPFEKTDADYEKLRDWIKKQESDYVKLRRGIMTACQDLKTLPVRFNKFIKDPEKQVNSTDMQDYLGVLENFLPLREPDDKAALYKLFIRTLTHEWEAAEPNKSTSLQELFAFAAIMKVSRNWIAHSNIFNKVNEQDIAFLFICNMRAMFELSNDLLIYEANLLNLFSKSLDAIEFNKKIGKTQQDRDLPLSKYYIALLEEAGKIYGTKTWETDFHNVLKNLQKDKAKNKSSDFFIEKLYQCFWFLTSTGYIYTPKMEYQFSHFKYGQTNFLLEFSRRIYNRSFS